MYLYFFIILAFLILLIDWYFYRAVKIYTLGSSPQKKNLIKYVYWGFTVLTILFLTYASYFYIVQIPPPKFARIYLFGFLFIVFTSKLLGSFWIVLHDVKIFVAHLYKQIKRSQPSSVGCSNNDEKEKISRKDFLKKAAVITAFIPFSSLLYGMLRTAFNFKILERKIPIKNLPEPLTKLNIVQISDIHLGSFISDEPIKQVVEMINGLNADIVFFTGDLVNEIAEEALPFIDILKQIKAKYGVYSILGNHDYGDYYYKPDDLKGKQHNRLLMQKIHKELGWNLLLNEHRVLDINNEKLAIIGVENWGEAKRFPKKGDIKKAKKGLLPELPTILLSHDPSHWNIKIKKHYPEIDLTLSGHTHGMQFGVEIPGFKWSPAKYLFKQWADLYQYKHQSIYVNRGIGFIGYPGRVGIAPEITLITLDKA